MDKMERTVAKRKFTRKLNSIKSHILAQSDASVIQELFQELKLLWSDVQDKHDHYVTSNFSDDVEKMSEEDKWIDVVESEYSEVESKILLHIRNCNDKDRSEMQRSSKIQREMEENAFSAIVKEAVSIISNKSGEIVAKQIKEELKSQFEKCREANKTVLSALKDEEDIKKELAWLTNLQTTYSHVLSEILKYIEINSVMAVSHVSEKMRSMKLERMQLPKFNGSIREYPRFKADFERHVMPEIKDEISAAYALKSCLGNSVADIVRNVDGSLADMWTRLNDKFGRASKLADVVIHDIKKLRPVEEGDIRKFVELVDVVETGYCDLQRVNFEKEISNGAVISIIEGKLPMSIQLKWSEKVNGRDSTVEDLDKFPHLLEFLLDQKRILEYVNTDLRRRFPQVRGYSNHIDSTREDEGEDNQERTSRGPNYRCLVHRENNHPTEVCEEYLAKDPAERVQLIREAGACWSCLKLYHRSAHCRSRRHCGKDGCTRYHNASLHDAHVQGVDFRSSNMVMMASQESNRKHDKVCLLQLMDIPVSGSNNQSVTVLWDGGATVSLITFKKAKALELHGTPIQITVIKVGGKRERIKSFEYNLPLLDKDGQEVLLQVYGINQISTSIERVIVDSVVKLFPNISCEDVARPVGEIDVLVGLEYAGFHPVREDNVGHLLLLANQFGKCLGGSHSMLHEGTRKLIQHVTIHHIRSIDIQDFYDIESLGVSCSPKCGGCKCGRCPIGSNPYTIREERELKLIDDGLKLDGNTWYASYPWIRDPSDLPDNFTSAYAMLTSTEKRLAKIFEYSAMYCQQINDMLERGVTRKLDELEIKSYDGPVHYLSHHEVLKPDSDSTPCRIVFNSSANFRGHVLNDYWAKGPDLLNNLVGILTRFRERNIAICGDIAKMYHTVKIGMLDQNTHRFLWRNMEANREPDVYVITSVSFGDRPAGSIATVALRKTAQLFSSVYPRAVEMIIENTYVDDMVDSVDMVSNAEQLTQEVDEILLKGGFKIKDWTIAGSKAESNHKGSNPVSTFVGQMDDGQKVLGMHWIPESDSFSFKVQLNFSPKVRKRRTGPNLSKHDVPSGIPKLLTKRMILSVVNGIFDPLGLAAPVIMKAKILMRKFHTNELKGLGWDDVIPSEYRNEWVEFFTELFEMEGIQFERCTKPSNSTGDPILIFFSDASGDAYVVCAYLRYELNDGSFQSRLVMSKSRLAPLRIISIVRLELCGALLQARLKEFLNKESRIKIAKLYHIVDSQIVRAMVQKESYGFNTFSAIRVGEIQESTEVSQWYWVSTKLNIADLVTRGASPKALCKGSIWQNGPDFLKLPEDEWPINNDITDVEVPDLAKSVMKLRVSVHIPKISDIIDIARYSKYTRLLHVTARILAICGREEKSLRFISDNLVPEMLQKAKAVWIKDAQSTLVDQFEKSKFSRLSAHRREDGTVVVGSRLRNYNIMSYDNKELVLLPDSHAFSQMYVEYIHGLSHSGVSATVAKVRLYFWIIGVRKMARTVVYKCVCCRRNKAVIETQVMGMLPEARLKPAPAFHSTFLDLFGPFDIRGEVNKRVRGKVYGLIFSCAVSRAVYLDIASDYSTPAFLMVLRRFVSLRGYPSLIISDPGSQLVAASKELRAVVDGLDKNKIMEFGVNDGLRWQFTSANAPWQNGCSEALIRSIKKMLKNIIGEQVLSFSELLTVMFEVGNLMNERPIGIHPTQPDEGSYLSPNHLLLGRATASVPSGSFDTGGNKQRYQLVQQIIDSFWKRWRRDYFPTLIVRNKWHIQRRNIAVGDIVIVQDTDTMRGKWKIARVSDVYPGNDGCVRNVQLQYKNLSERSTPHYTGSKYTEIRRPVQKVVVLLPVEGDSEDLVANNH